MVLGNILVILIILCIDVLISSYYHISIVQKSSLILLGSNKFKSIPKTPEFSRIVNVAQISPRKPAVCRILAKESERVALADRFDVEGLSYFAANVTLTRKDPTSIVITGSIAATIYNGDLFPENDIFEEFDTMILDNSNTNSLGEKINIEDAVDYDDEIGPNGEIDIGEIAAQYLSLEIY